MTEPEAPARFLLVGLEPGLDRAQVMGIYAALTTKYPGVEFVCDLSIVSQDTLDKILLPRDLGLPTANPKSKRRRSAV